MLNIAINSIIEQIPGCVGWKDANFKYLGGNLNLLAAKNLQYEEELIGRTDDILSKKYSKLNEFYYQQDLLALQGHSLEIIYTDPYDDKAYFLQKSPLRDINANIIGVIYYCKLWSKPDFIKLLQQVDKKYLDSTGVVNYYAFDQHHNTAQLSERELECLFLQLHGKTAKEIAIILGLSKRTIESYVDNIKAKMGSQNKSELLIKAMTQGYQHYIPKKFISNSLPVS